MTRKRFLSTLFLTLLAGLAAFGCEKKEPDMPPIPRPGPPPGGNITTGGPTTTGQKFKVVFIPKNTGNPFFDVVSEGFKKSASELGFEYDMVGPSSGDATSQIPIIKAQIQQGVNAIAISANSPDAVAPALKEAQSKGIKVITLDADTTGHEDAREAFVMPVDFANIGKSQIELMGSLIGYKGDFAILSATTDAPNQNMWIQGMKEALASDPKYKDMKLVDTVYGDDKEEKSLTEANALLTKYPNLKGILAPTSVGVTKAAQAVEQAKAAPRVQVTGLGLPSQMSVYIQNGTVQKFALWDPAQMGYVGGYLLNGLLKGEIKAGEGTTFKAGTTEHKFGPKNVVIAGEPLVFDKANIAQYKF